MTNSSSFADNQNTTVSGNTVNPQLTEGTKIIRFLLLSLPLVLICLMLYLAYDFTNYFMRPFTLSGEMPKVEDVDKKIPAGLSAENYQPVLSAAARIEWMQDLKRLGIAKIFFERSHNHDQGDYPYMDATVRFTNGSEIKMPNVGVEPIGAGLISFCLSVDGRTVGIGTKIDDQSKQNPSGKDVYENISWSIREIVGFVEQKQGAGRSRELKKG
jgi:hypothetical protein